MVSCFLLCSLLIIFFWFISGSTATHEQHGIQLGDMMMGHHDPGQNLKHSIAILMLFSQDDLSGYIVAKSSPGRDHFQG